jgi:hypothetical protein
LYFQFRKQYGAGNYPDGTRNENTLDLFSGSFIEDTPSVPANGKLIKKTKYY